jgi:hypothetical protein
MTIEAELHWYEAQTAQGIQDKQAAVIDMTRAQKKTFVVCLSNDGYAASLEPRKIYVALHDAGAGQEGFLRVIDESGEDYLYERDRFAALKLPVRLQKALAAANDASRADGVRSSARSSGTIQVRNSERSRRPAR